MIERTVHGVINVNSECPDTILFQHNNELIIYNDYNIFSVIFCCHNFEYPGHGHDVADQIDVYWVKTGWCYKKNNNLTTFSRLSTL